MDIINYLLSFVGLGKTCMNTCPDNWKKSEDTNGYLCKANSDYKGICDIKNTFSDTDDKKKRKEWAKNCGVKWKLCDLDSGSSQFYQKNKLNF